MAFTLDTKHSAVVEKNLFKNSVLQPGSTYTTRWQGDASAGVVKITKLTKGTILTSGAGISSGFDLTVGANNTLLSLNLDKPYSISTAIYDVQEASVSIALASEHMEMNTMGITEAWNKGGMDVLIAGATPLEQAKPTTGATFEAAFLAARKVIVQNGGKANVLIASVDMYNLMLSDKNKFIPSTNEQIMATGIVGLYNGIKVYEYQDFGTINSSAVDFVLYDFEAFAVATNVAAARIVPGAPHIVGVFAQTAINSGFLVTNAERVVASGVDVIL